MKSADASKWLAQFKQKTSTKQQKNTGKQEKRIITVGAI